MQDSNTTFSSQSTQRREGGKAALPPAGSALPRKGASPAAKAQPQGWIKRIIAFVARLWTGKPKVQAYAADANAASRAATSIAAQLSPPMAFKGDTTSTLATPISTYAGGKPVNLAIRKRAEQQFDNMDLSNTTMN